MAVLIAMKSKDKETKVGAVIVDHTNTLVQVGFNSPPRGVDDDVSERFVRPEKYLWMSHAETNAVTNCARLGIPTIDTKIYSLCLPCPECARIIIQAGIKEVILWNKFEADCIRDDYDHPTSRVMFFESGVTVRVATVPIVERLVSMRRGHEIV